MKCRYILTRIEKSHGGLILSYVIFDFILSIAISIVFYIIFEELMLIKDAMISGYYVVSVEGAFSTTTEDPNASIVTLLSRSHKAGVVGHWLSVVSNLFFLPGVARQADLYLLAFLSTVVISAWSIMIYLALILTRGLESVRSTSVWLFNVDKMPLQSIAIVASGLSVICFAAINLVCGLFAVLSDYWCWIFNC